MQLVWRYFVVQKSRDPVRAEAIRRVCTRDCLFYLNTFWWLDEPRAQPNCIPFNTYDYQDRFILKVLENINRSCNPDYPDQIFDVGVDKSRTMGITWSALAPIDWLWRFAPGSQFLLISKKETDVDNVGNMKALMPKLDYVEERMPNFLRVRGRRHNVHGGRSHLLIYNKANGSSITGESSNPNAGRSGRYLAVLRDEEAFTDNGDTITTACTETTNVQIRVSTPNGIANSFFKARKAREIDWFTFHWTLHPTYSQGLYEYKDGQVRIVDEAWHRRFRRDRGAKYKTLHEPTHADPDVDWEFLRSPWFDARCRRYAHDPYKIAQELQISYHGTGSPYFNASKIAELRRLHGRRPDWSGDLSKLIGYTFEDTDPRPDRARCWFEPISARPPQNTTYTFGIDVSTGTGVSDSAVSVVDDTSKEKVFEFISRGILPEAFAQVIQALFTWFSTPSGVPFLSWDQGGPGLAFGAKILELGNMPVYYYKEKDRRGSRSERRPGLPAGGRAGKSIKGHVFERFRTALYGGWHITHSFDCYNQCLEYVYPDKANGAPQHVASKDVEDVSGKGEQHGDVVVSEIIAFIAALERPMPQPRKPASRPGSFVWRLEKWKDQQRQLASARVGEW